MSTESQMPSNPIEEFRWVSIDRGISHETVLKQAKDKIYSLSFEDDAHPLGTKHVPISTQPSKLHSKTTKNVEKTKTASKNVPTKKASTFIDPLSAMSAKSEEDIDDFADDTSEISEIGQLQISDKT